MKKMTDTILIDYLKGLLNHDDRDKVEAWYNIAPENKKKLEDLYFLLFVSDRIDAVQNIDENKSFIKFKKSLQKSAKVTKVSALRKATAIAAIFIGLLFMGSSITLYFLDKNPQQIIVATQLGERAKVTLPDGTKVWLNASSNIEYSKSIFSRQREVTLNGEGYFEVSSKKYSPFIVSNKTSKIKVLGTKFNVKCNEDENFISASLLEGSILFSEEQVALEVILKPGEEIIYDRIKNDYILQTIKSDDDAIGWLDGKIIFNNSTLAEIAKELERHYNVRISFADDKVSKERFNADFETPDNIYQIVSILARTNKFDYTFQKSNRKIVITSKQ